MIENKDAPPLDESWESGSSEGESAARSFVAEAVRKAVLAGVGALFLTEEGARKLAREWKLPKELAGYVVTQAQGAKDEVRRILTQEVRRFLESETFRHEVKELISAMTVAVKAEIRFKDFLKEPPKGKSASARSTRPPRHGGGEEGESTG